MEFKKPAIFIGGPGRSGTSFLSYLLDCHPKIAVLGETKFLSLFAVAREFPEIIYKCKKKDRLEAASRMAQVFLGDFWKFPHRPERGLHRVFEKEEIIEVLPILDQLCEFDDLESIEKGYGYFLGSLFSQYSRRQGKPFWAEKTPQVEKYAATLLRFFPNIRLVCMYRDGRDTACSLVEQSWGPDDYYRALDWWAGNTWEGLKATNNLPPDIVLNIRYEDLVSKPDWVFSNLMSFLGFVPDPNAEPLIPRKTAVGRWKNELPVEAAKYAEEKHGKLLAGLGYL